MHCASDHSLHKEYVRRLIAGKTDPKQSKGVYKIVMDPRVTRVGEFLRKTSLDEFPQFLNVLKGEMSLVGPRPPIPYEFESYDIWHRRRVLEVQPGITGLWQVTGRSRTNFDDMVADALYLYTQKKPLVMVHESLASFVDTGRTRPTVLKLHGDAFRPHVGDHATEIVQLAARWRSAHVADRDVELPGKAGEFLIVG